MPGKQTREYNRFHSCARCGVGFDSSRYDAQFCSAKCRKAAQRQRTKAAKDARRILELIQAFRDEHIIGLSADEQSVNAGKLSQVSNALNGILSYWSN